MSCREHEGTILDVARGVAGEAETSVLLHHARECPACDLVLRRERALTAVLRTLAGTTRADGPSPSVEAALLAAFADRQCEARSRAGAWPTWMAAAAAVVLLAAAGALWRGAQVAEPREAPPLAARSVGGWHGLGTVRPAVEGMGVSRIIVRVARPTRETGLAVRAGAETGGAFVPWPGAAALPGFDSGHLVRTQLPASVLPLLGIAMADLTGQDRVEADVVVGQDGFARAVRLVRQKE